MAGAEVARIWDSKTKTVTTLPRTELTADYIKVRIEGQDGEFWIKASSMEDSPQRHTDLGPSLEKRVEALHLVLAPILGHTREDWRLGFLRDQNPENEVRIWERVVRAYKAAISGRKLAPAKQKAVLRALVIFSSNGTASPTASVESPHLTKNEIVALAPVYEETGAET